MDIINKIKEITGVDNFLHKSGRTKQVINAKMLYAKYKRDVEGLTFRAIAKEFGHIQHGSVINLVNRFNDYSMYDSELRNNYNSLLNKQKTPYQTKVYSVLDELMGLDSEADLDYILEKMRINIKVRTNTKLNK
jgi:hypothetical protein